MANYTTGESLTSVQLLRGKGKAAASNIQVLQKMWTTNADDQS